MNSSIANWKTTNDRRGNLALAAQLTLGNGQGNRDNIQNYSTQQASRVPRVRGGAEYNNDTNQFMETQKHSRIDSYGSSNGFVGFREENKGFKASQTGFNPISGTNNELNYLNQGYSNKLMSSNNIKNQYTSSDGHDILDNFQNPSSTNFLGETNGFKVSRVRSGAQLKTMTDGSNQSTARQIDSQSNIGSNVDINSPYTLTSIGFGSRRNISKKDVDCDTDGEIMYSQQKMRSLNQNQFTKQDNKKYENSLSPRVKNTYTFNIPRVKLAQDSTLTSSINGSERNIHNNNENDQSNNLNSTQSGMCDSIYRNEFIFSNENTSDNNDNNHNKYDNFGPLELNNSIKGSNNSHTNNTGSNTIINTENNNFDNTDNKIDSTKNQLNTKTEDQTLDIQASQVKKDPKKSETYNEESQQFSKEGYNSEQQSEFQTGSYDPSNIMSQTRQGRMRNLGKNNQNQHEEKPAQATGNKNIPDQEPQQEELKCPQGCGRTFNKKALEKHIPLCKKIFTKKDDLISSKSKPEEKDKFTKNLKGINNQQKASNIVGQKSQSIGYKQQIDQKNEDLRKLKEQMKKEMTENKQKENKMDDELINEPNQQQYY